MTNIAQEFEAEVAKATSLIVEASRKAALAMVDEAFGRRPITRRATAMDAGRRPGPAGKSVVRRTAQDIESTAERLMQALWATPGQTSNDLASRVGVRPAELKVPMRRLIDQGRVKKSGINQFTKYFPVSGPGNGARQAQ